MDPHITDWVTKSAPVPKEIELATYQFEFDDSAYEPFIILFTAFEKVIEKWREAFQELAKEGESFEIL